ncbi:hypothetical protein PHLCEN_2v6464 [Hermanssonia centrifuga]|uniref:ATPase WRNIP1 n=1 Tax=Hermanssonia centrifuga TaxID=98765 RepID=A0A2R6NZ63_9APHY|nr:hypothetical protein PHLCEN_2v6464 [Hermanssonia centrifuga]
MSSNVVRIEYSRSITTRPDINPHSPVCSRDVLESRINDHLDNDCSDTTPSTSKVQLNSTPEQRKDSKQLAPIFGSANKQHVARTASLQTATQKRRITEDNASPIPGPSKRSKTTKSKFASAAPLAERLRPQTLEEFIGQPQLTGPDSLLLSLIHKGSTGSMIFWGPPGYMRLLLLTGDDTDVVGWCPCRCGKTTLARLLAKSTDAAFKELSATDSGISDVRAVGEEAKGGPFSSSTRCTDSTKPSNVFVLNRLTDDDITRIVKQAVKRASPSETLSQSSDSTAVDAPDDINTFPQLTPKLLSTIVSLSAGDARTALSLLELVLSAAADADPDNLLISLRQSVSTSYDRTGDSRYDMISALHKSVRGSQGSAAMYWLARMLTAGEDPVYIARRMVVCASEDVGLADNHALPLAMAALQACQLIGMPECRINLAHLVAYLSEAPKSTRSYEAYKRAEEAAKLDLTLPVPPMVRNAPTSLMKELGYSDGYAYNPDYLHPVTNDYLPTQFETDVFLRPCGDTTGKVWDEDALQRWEIKENNSEKWEGRTL